MDVSIIIVSWNVKDLLKENLQALYASVSDITFEVFVIDNNSADESAEMVREYFPQAHIIANKDNRGFAKANNQAIEKATGRYVLLLNPDMRVHDTTLQDMVLWMDSNPQAAVAGCHLVDEAGGTVPHVRRFPRLFDQSILITKLSHVFPSLLNGYMMTDFDYSRESLVDSIRGSFFMIRKNVIEKIGGLDERYFIWFEEVDYCKMVYKAGLEVWYTPDITCIDFIGKSFSQVMGFKKQIMFTDSMQKYFHKWHPGFQSHMINVLRPIGLGLAKIYDSMRPMKK